MSSNMTPMEVGILFIEFSAIPDSEKQRFLQQHPELRSAWRVGRRLGSDRCPGSRTDGGAGG